ncbi:hypothetical protein V2G26_007291 [Clonostachys chloroleuca]
MAIICSYHNLEPLGSATQKRRPRESPSLRGSLTDKKQILEARRKKNREAQHVFRKQRQAAEAALGRHARRLEEVVEEMSSTLICLFDEILATEALITRHPSITTSLKQALAQVLSLTKEIATLDGDSLLPADDSTAASGDSAEPVPQHIIENTVTTSTQRRPSLPGAPLSLVDPPSASRQSMMSRPYTPSLGIYRPATPISAGYTPTNQLLTSLPLTPQTPLSTPGTL